MKNIVSIVIGFLHDFASGCWVASVFAVYWLERQSISFQAIDSLVELKKQFFFIGLGCIVLVFFTGAGRTFTYVGNVYGKNPEKTRKKLLIVKHVFLLIVFSFGSCWQYNMVFS